MKNQETEIKNFVIFEYKSEYFFFFLWQEKKKNSSIFDAILFFFTFIKMK